MRGCKEVVSYSVYERHVNELCKLKNYKCRHEGCDRTLAFGEMEVHEEECDHRLLACELCKNLIKKFVLEFHNLNECEFRIMSCDDCDGLYQFSDKDH